MMPECFNQPCPRGRHGKRGVTFAECIISTLIVGLMLAGALEALGTTSRIKAAESNTGTALTLAQELMEEVLSKDFSDPDGGTPFTLDAGETAGDRTTFDDVDDYAGLVESPPKDKTGNPRADLVGWQRVVYVDKVSFAAFDTATATNTGYRRVVVKVTRDGVELASLIAIRANSEP